MTDQAKVDQLKREAKDCLAFGRRAVYDRHVYFISTLYNLKLVEDESIDTMGVDDGNRLFYSPEFTAKYGRSYAGTFLFHEVGHIFRFHKERFDEYRPVIESLFKKHRATLAIRFGIMTMHDLWNWAGDLEINSHAEAQGWKWPKDFSPVTPKNLGYQERLPAEEYVKLLCQDSESNKSKHLKVFASAIPGAGGKCGGCAGNPQDHEDKEKPKKMDSASKQVIRKATANAIVAHEKAHGRGSVPGDLLHWAEKQLEPPVIDWRRTVPSIIRRSMDAASGAVDYRFGKASRRATGDFQLPTLYKPRVKLGCGFDTSGSMMGSRTKKAAQELMGIVKAFGKVNAFAVDAKLQKTMEVKSPSDLEKLIKGGGGTDMRIAIQEGARQKLDVLIVLTDAESPWPKPEEMPRGMRVIVCVIGDCRVPDGIATVVRVKE